MQSNQYFSGDESNQEQPLAAFAVVNLRGSYCLTKALSVFGSVTNLFDRGYATFGTFSDTSDIALAEAPGASDPRSVSPGGAAAVEGRAASGVLRRGAPS